ncbi:hypothetical protein [Nonomuraea sp. LPB2021202275-12-8]|uniref:hypothetical protein n=1 Tax=Nonomuraea sp. LPB2021202275-12-8 TaxID=3120159 RepID=UPI00300D8DFE
MRVGCIRVSSVDQNTVRQLDGIAIERTFFAYRSVLSFTPATPGPAALCSADQLGQALPPHPVVVTARLG